MPIKKILVAVDSSKHSLKAGVQAIELASKFDAELTALHVVPAGRNFSQLEEVQTGRYKELMNMEMEDAVQLVEKVKKMAAEKNVVVRTKVIVGITSIVKEIVEYAEDNKMNMIVVGSRGLSGFKKMVLGSIASGLVTYSHCPVLVVK